jgi:hypothetical protein
LSCQDEVTVTSLHAAEIVELCESVGRSSMQEYEMRRELRRGEVQFRGLDWIHATGASVVRELQKQMRDFLQTPRLSVTRVGASLELKQFASLQQLGSESWTKA